MSVECEYPIRKSGKCNIFQFPRRRALLCLKTFVPLHVASLAPLSNPRVHQPQPQLGVTDTNPEPLTLTVKQLLQVSQLVERKTEEGALGIGAQSSGNRHLIDWSCTKAIARPRERVNSDIV